MKKVCVVGCGSISPVHINALKETKYADLFAVCDIVPEKADKCANKYGAKAFYNFDDVISCSEIDSVHICTPHYLHVEMAIKALESGKYVVLEKPAAINLEELKKLQEANEKHKGKLSLILQNRTNPCVVALNKDIKETDCGNLLGSKAFLTWKRTKEYYEKDAWRGKWATEGGGLMINQAVHILDLLCWLSGGVKSVKATMSNKTLADVIEVEDTAEALFKLKNGGDAVLFATNAYTPNGSVNLELNFENVTYRYADSFLYKIEKGKMPTIIADDNVSVKWKNYWGAGHLCAINAFYSAISGENNDYITLDDGLNSAKTLLAMYESAKNNGVEILIN